MFLKSETKTDLKPTVKITLQYKRSSAFCEREKSPVKSFSNKKKRSFNLLSFEVKPIDVGAKKPKLRPFEIRAFCDQMRSFCTISASTFWKIQPEDGNKTLIFKRFRLFWSRFDSSDCESPSKSFLLSNFDIPAYYLAGSSTRLSTVTSPVSRVPTPPPSHKLSSHKLL